ncbi:MAG: mechanosensitive ion channel [Planctomycetaceae bacterium]|nr:mechanosensitive ion channel [Planctomycetaceae bacterium]
METNPLTEVNAQVVTCRDALVTSFNETFNQLAHLAPKVVGMVVVLVVGYLLARVIDRVIAALAESLKLDTAAERSGLADSMKKVGIGQSVPTIVGKIGFWLTMCVFISAAFNVLGLEAMTTAMNKVVSYIPNLLVATVVIVVGMLAATFVRGIVATSADRVGISYAEQLANACYYVLGLMTFLAAFDQVGFQFGLIKEMVLIAFAALALGFGLAFGLGGREVMAGILAGYYTRQRLQAGDKVTIGHLEGTVREVGPVATTIETAEDGLINRHTVPNVKMLNEAIR